MSFRNKIFYFLVVTFGIYLFVYIPVVKNCSFIADDLPVIFFSDENPLPIASHWESGLEKLIPDLKIEYNHYRPITSLLTFLSFKIFNFNPSLWVLLSQLINFTNFLLIIVVANQIRILFNKKENYTGYFLAVFYLFYPGNVTNLAWISARTDLIIIFFCLFSFYFTLKFIQTNRKRYLSISAAIYLLGLFTKENALSWFVVEFVLIWQIYRLLNRPPQLVSSLVKILNVKVSACIVYILFRSAIAMIDTKSAFKEFNFLTTVTAYLKSLLFTLLPVDSGTFIYSYVSSPAVFAICFFLFFTSLIYIVYIFFSGKEKFVMSFIFFLITASTLSFYAIAGGGTYRLFVLTFVSILLFSYNLLLTKHIKIPFKISFVILFLFFVFGSYKISGYWIENYRLQNESLSSLEKIYDKGKENVIINYPHSLGQSYCFSDIGTYLFFKMNGQIGRYNNITSLAAINSYDEIHYVKENKVEEYGNEFIISSNFNDTYFSHEPFFTEKSVLGEKYNNLKNYTFEVLKLNSFSKPIGYKIKYSGIYRGDVNYIEFAEGTFKKFK